MSHKKMNVVLAIIGSTACIVFMDLRTALASNTDCKKLDNQMWPYRFVEHQNWEDSSSRSYVLCLFKQTVFFPALSTSCCTCMYYTRG